MSDNNYMSTDNLDVSNQKNFDLDNFLKPRKQETDFHFAARCLASLKVNKTLWIEKIYLYTFLNLFNEITLDTKIKILLQSNLSLIKIEML